MIRTRLVGTIAGVLLLCGLASAVHGLSPDQFIQYMQTKFQRTGRIYLEATSRRVDRPGDTTRIALAYQYPDRFLQWVRGKKNRERIAIFDEQTVVLSYPHLDITRRRTMTREEIRKLLVQRVPLVGLIAGFQVEEIRQFIDTRTEGDWLWVEMQSPRQDLPYRTVRIKFSRGNLHPRSIIMEGTGRYEVTITRYTEDEPFPKQVDAALDEMNPRLLEGPLR